MKFQPQIEQPSDQAAEQRRGKKLQKLLVFAVVLWLRLCYVLHQNG